MTSLDEPRVTVLPDGRLSRRDAATYLGLKRQTLAAWAVAGRGPRSLSVGGRCFYRLKDLDAFIREGNEDEIEPGALR